MSSIRAFRAVRAKSNSPTFPVRPNSSTSYRPSSEHSFLIRFLPWVKNSLAISCFCIFVSGCGVQNQKGSSGTSATNQATGSAANYQTNFPDKEVPLSQSGEWTNGGTTGLDWNNCQSKPGFAFGTQPGTKIADDSICLLPGGWNSNQSAQITLKINSTSNASQELEEMWLRTTLAAHSLTGYEIFCSISPGNPFLRLSRWNGAKGDYTVLATVSTTCVDGDVLKATVSGSTFTVYKNGTSKLIVTDSKYTSGSPGMGFYIRDVVSTAATANAEFGVSAFSATGSASTAGSTGGSTGGTTGSATPHQVSLSWNAPASSSDPVKGYNIYRSTGSSPFQRINSSVDDQTAYQDGSVQSGVTYKYYVTTVDSSGIESGPSNTTTLSVP